MTYDPSAWHGPTALDEGQAATIFDACGHRDRGLATAYNGGFLVDGPRCVGIIVTDEGMTTSRPSTHRSASADRTA